MRFGYGNGDQPLAGFTIRRGVGVGGFGEVYLATNDAGKEVALKRIQKNLDVEARGVRQCINLRHTHLIDLYDLRIDDQGQGWIVMEYVAGESLRDRIDRNPQGLPTEDVLSWFGQVASAVAYLHDSGIVHRDLKPANIFIDGSLIKIGDYGLTKFISQSRRGGQTESVGTLHYMAPEIGKGEYGKEIDIYALGIILCEMLTGEVPFDGESGQEILLKHLTQRPDLRHLPEPFRSVIDKALAKDPKERYASVRQMLLPLGLQIEPNGLAARIHPPAATLSKPAPGHTASPPILEPLPALDPDAVRFGPVEETPEATQAKRSKRLQKTEWWSPDGQKSVDAVEGWLAKFEEQQKAWLAKLSGAQAKEAGRRKDKGKSGKPWDPWSLWAGLLVASLLLQPLSLFRGLFHVVLWGGLAALIVWESTGRKRLLPHFLTRFLPGNKSGQPIQSLTAPMPMTRKQWVVAERQRLAAQPKIERWQAITGNWFFAFCVVSVLGILGTLFGGGWGRWEQPGWLAAACWSGLVIWGGSSLLLALASGFSARDEDGILFRFLQLASGMALGAGAFFIAQYLMIPWDLVGDTSRYGGLFPLTKMVQYSDNQKMIETYSLTADTVTIETSEGQVSKTVPRYRWWGSFYEENGLPTLPVYLIHFGLLFGMVRWWRMADPLRRRRLSLLGLAGALVVETILTGLIPIAQPWGWAIAAGIAGTVSLASPWIPYDHGESARQSGQYSWPGVGGDQHRKIRETV